MVIARSELDKLAALESGEATADGFIRTSLATVSRLAPTFVAVDLPPPILILDPLQVDPVLAPRMRVDCVEVVPGRVWTPPGGSPILVTDENVDQLRLTAGCSPFKKAVDQTGEDFNVAGCFQSTRCPAGAPPPPGDFAGDFVTVPDGVQLANTFARANGGAPNGASGAGLEGCRILGLDCVVVGLIAALFLLPLVAGGRGGTLSLG